MIERMTEAQRRQKFIAVVASLPHDLMPKVWQVLDRLEAYDVARKAGQTVPFPTFEDITGVR